MKDRMGSKVAWGGIGIAMIFLLCSLCGCSALAANASPGDESIFVTDKDDFDATKAEIKDSEIPAYSGIDLEGQPEKERKKELDGKLKILSFIENGRLDEIAMRFMNENPNVNIEIEECFDSSENFYEQYEVYRKRLMRELIDGSGYDLIQTRDITIDEYCNQGILEDIYGFINNDSRIIKEDYYTNIWKACENDGRLYEFPIAFSYDLVKLNLEQCHRFGAEPSSYKTINGHQMSELCNRVKEKLELPDDFVLVYKKEITVDFFSPLENRRFMDVSRCAAKFDSEDFINYLKWSKGLPHERKYSEDMSGLMIKDYSDITDSAMFSVEKTFTSRIGDIKASEPYVSEAIPLVSTDGSYCFNVSCGFCMPTCGQNKELAWEFLYYLIKERETMEKRERETFSFSFIPININNFYAAFKQYSGDDKESMDKVHSWNLLRNRKSYVNYGLDILFRDTLIDYYDYDDRLTAEQTAAIIQKKAEEYFSELGN